MTLRPYQSQAVDNVFSAWESGKRSVCLVAPTGAGKTITSASIVQRKNVRTVWLAHRKELIGQSAATLEKLGLRTGVVAPGFPLLPGRQVQVASWQTLLDPEKRPPAELLVIDECHHAPAEEWLDVIRTYSGVPVIGATATPERGDGKPMNDVFDALVVAANYSELIKAGHLVPCRVFRPEEEVSDGLAKDPLDAYVNSPAKGLPGIGFGGSVRDCERFAEAFTAAGYKSAVLSAGMSAAKRVKLVKAYRNGELAFLWSVYVLTEGFDAPHASVCIIARGCGSTGTYLQMVGRVLRPYESKLHAFLLDLRGVSYRHGLPTEDRTYSLDGKPISSTGSLRVCQECGMTYDPLEDSSCPGCGAVRERLPLPESKGPVIHDLALAEVYAGDATPDSAKRTEFERLTRVASLKGWGATWVARQYRALFKTFPPGDWFPRQVKFTEFRRLQKLQNARGFKPGFAATIFKQTFGHWPEKQWQWKTDQPWLQR